MDDHTSLPFNLPAVARKNVTAAFDGGESFGSGSLPFSSS